MPYLTAQFPFVRFGSQTTVIDGYTQQMLAAQFAAASGKVGDARLLAISQAAARLYGSALASARITPPNPALDAATRYSIGESLVLDGVYCAIIDLVGTRLRLVQASIEDVRGKSPSPDSWMYDLEIPTPDGSVRRTVAAPGVVHIQWGAAGTPLASITANTLGAIENAILAEANAAQGQLFILPTPQTKTNAETQAAVKAVQTSIQKARGSSVVFNVGAAQWSEAGRNSGSKSYSFERFGSEFDPTAPALREQAASDLLAALGIPPALLGRTGDGTGSREAMRQFLHGSLQPLAARIATELSDKLDAKSVRFDFTELFAADIQGRARAYGSLTKAGMDASKAERIAGLSGSQ